MPAGRPTEYRPEFGEQIIEKMREGLSLTAAAADLGFHRQRAYEWAERHPEFADAIRFGRGARVSFLEKEMLSSDVGPRVTARIFALKNADPEEWRERVVSENTGPNGGPQEHVVTHKISDESAELLSELTATLRGA
jgi:hypothetical protein